jgi:hypothetical protein
MTTKTVQTKARVQAWLNEGTPAFDRWVQRKQEHPGESDRETIEWLLEVEEKYHDHL